MTVKSIESFISLIQEFKSSGIPFKVIGNSEDYQRGCNFDNVNTHHKIYLCLLTSIGQFKYVESIKLSDTEKIADIKAKICANIPILPIPVEYHNHDFYYSVTIKGIVNKNYALPSVDLHSSQVLSSSSSVTFLRNLKLHHAQSLF